MLDLQVEPHSYPIKTKTENSHSRFYTPILWYWVVAPCYLLSERLRLRKNGGISRSPLSAKERTINARSAFGGLA